MALTDPILKQQIREGRVPTERVIEVWREIQNGKRNRFPLHILEKAYVRIALVRTFVDEFKAEHGRYPYVREFHKAKLHGIMKEKYYGDSSYNALEDAGYLTAGSKVYDPLLAAEPWTQLEHLPGHFFDSRKNAKRATRWLLAKTGKPITEVNQKDFVRNNLSCIIKKYGGHPYHLFNDLGMVQGLEPWEFNSVPDEFFDSIKNRKSAIRWLVEKTGKKPKDIGKSDFDENCLGGLLHGRHYKGFIFPALKEAGYLREPTELTRVPNNFYGDRTNRVSVIKKVVGSSGKEPEYVQKRDFEAAGRGRVLTFYNGLGDALRDAGYKI